MPRLLRAIVVTLSTLGRNAVPAVGIFAEDWAPANAMLLYLVENVVLVLLAAATVRLVGPPSGEIAGKPRTRGESLRLFFLIAVPFTVGAAAISAVVLDVPPDREMTGRDFLHAFLTMLAFQLLAFGAGIGRMRGATLSECEDLLVGVLGRVFLLALAVWTGVFLALFVSSAFLVPFIALKAIADLGRIGSFWRPNPGAPRFSV